MHYDKDDGYNNDGSDDDNEVSGREGSQESVLSGDLWRRRSEENKNDDDDDKRRGDEETHDDETNDEHKRITS